MLGPMSEGKFIRRTVAPLISKSRAIDSPTTFPTRLPIWSGLKRFGLVYSTNTVFPASSRPLPNVSFSVAAR